MKAVSISLLLFFALVIHPSIFAAEGNLKVPNPAPKVKTALGNKPRPENELVPHGWEELQRTKGDLNGDGIDDLALAIRKKEGDILPEVLLIFLGNPGKKFQIFAVGGRHLWEYEKTYIDQGGITAMKIKNGVLTVSLNSALSMGTWYADSCIQKWRMEGHKLRLIGRTAGSLHRGFGAEAISDLNLLTGKEIVSTRAATGEKPVVHHKKGKPKKVFWEDFVIERDCKAPELPMGD